MSFLATIASTLLLSSSPASLAPVNQVPIENILSVRFKDGTVARVRVLGIQGERVQLREIVLDGSMAVRHLLSDFEPVSAFRIELAARNPETFEGLFSMAQRAAEMGLDTETGQLVAAAKRSIEGRVDAERENSVLRTWSSDTLEGWLNESLESRDLAKSMHYLKLLSSRYADLRTEEQLDQLAEAVETLERDRAAKRRAIREERLDKKTLARIERLLEPIRARLDKGDRLYRSAITKSGKMTQSARLASDAIDAYISAWEASLEIQQKYPDEESLVFELESIANHLHDHAILSALHAANVLAVRGDFLGAQERVQWVLALDPAHEEALEMQKTITLASSTSSAGWIFVGWGQDARQGGGNLR